MGYLFVATFEFPFILLAFGRDWRRGWEDPLLSILRVKLKIGVLAAFCIAYGISRAGRHPGFTPFYLKWLRTTPWTSRSPLPLGDPQLNWRDVIVLAPAAAVAYSDLAYSPADPLCFFGVVYLFLGALTLYLNAVPEMILLAIGFGGVILEGANPPAMLAVLIAMYAVYFVGLKRSLRRLPWPRVDEKKKRPGELGWPFRMLDISSSPQVISYQAALIASVLAGWWVFCAGVQAEEQNGPAMPVALMVAAIAGAIFSIARLLIYCAQTKSPMSLLARIVTGRLIIPKFDYVFLAPIATFIAPIWLAWHGDEYSHSPALVAAISVGICIGIATSAGPTRRHWLLTGHYRIARLSPQRAWRREVRRFIAMTPD